MFRKKTHKSRIPILPTLAGVNYLIQIGTAGGKLDLLKSGDLSGYFDWALKDGIMYGTGYNIVDKTWDFGNFMTGTGTIIVAGLASKVLSKLGANRAVSKIPFIGNKITL